jgi:hypothetical protein
MPGRSDQYRGYEAEWKSLGSQRSSTAIGRPDYRVWVVSIGVGGDGRVCALLQQILEDLQVRPAGPAT